MDAVLHVIGHLVLMEKYDLVCYTRQYNFSGIRATRYPINIPYTHYTGLIRIPNNQHGIGLGYSHGGLAYGC